MKVTQCVLSRITLKKYVGILEKKSLFNFFSSYSIKLILINLFYCSANYFSCNEIHRDTVDMNKLE